MKYKSECVLKYQQAHTEVVSENGVRKESVSSENDTNRLDVNITPARCMVSRSGVKTTSQDFLLYLFFPITQ